MIMSDLVVTSNNDQLTMSSREVARLCEKRHDNVIADIRKMFVGLDLDALKFQESYFDAYGRQQAAFSLPRRECDILIAGYNLKYRAAIVDRWHELESQKGMTAESSILKHVSPVAKVIIEDLNGTIEHLQSETQRLNSVCNDLASNLREGVTPAAFARMLNGVNTNRVQPALVERKRLLKTQHGYRAAAAYRDKLFTERRHINEEGRLCERVVLTLRGAKWLYAEYEKGQLDMKKDWDGEYSHLTFGEGAAE